MSGSNETPQTKGYKRPSKMKMILYSLNGIFGVLMFSMWGQIQFFAASLLLIPQIVIFLIYTSYSLVDGFNDPVLGYLADRSTRFTVKYGKRFPWIMLGFLIGPILLILCFIPVSVIQVDTAGNVLNWDAVIIAAVWLTIMMCTYETFLTLSEINYASLTPDLFREVEGRTNVGGIRMLMTVIGNIMAVLLITPVIGGLGGETSKTAYLITALIIAVISYILIIPFSWGVREPEEMKELRARLDKEKKTALSVKPTIIRIFKDKNWMAIVIAFFLWATAGSCMTAGMNFFVIHSLGLGIEVTAIPALVASIVVIISIPVWIIYTRRIGTKKAYILGFIFLAITYFLFFFVTDLLGIIIVYAFGGIGYAAGWGIVFTVIQAEAIDNAAVKTGVREEGSYIGILRIFSAFSYSFQTLIFAIVSSITGYNPAFETAQTEFAKFGLKFQMSIIPLVISLIAIIIFVLMYKITKEDAETNREKLLEMGL